MERPDEMPGPIDTSSPQPSSQDAPAPHEQPVAGESPPSSPHATLLDAIAELAAPADISEITAADVDVLRLALNGAVPPRPLTPTAFMTAPEPVPPPAPQAVLEPLDVILEPPRPLVPVMFLQPEAPAEVPAPQSPISAIIPPLPARTFERPSLAATRAPIPISTAISKTASTAPDPLDPIFSEIDREASTRSLTAIETATSAAAPESEPEQSPIFPTSRPQANPIPDLGHQIPGMPRFETHSSPTFPALEPLAVDPAAVRPVGVEAPYQRPATSTPRTGILRRILRVALLLAVGWLALVLLLIVVFRFVDPPGSSLMLQQWLGGEKITQRWVPIEAMSPQIVRAVVASEDARFCQHYGIDFGALRDAVEDVGTGRVRGASTISMQVTKNLFLWPSKSYLRKVIEFPLTFALETVWPKRRILEVYLNIAEWGPGIFGIQAASQYHFGKSAGTLSAGDASRLAAALPNPLARNPARPGAGMKRLVRALQVRARTVPASQIACAQPLRRL